MPEIIICNCCELRKNIIKYFFRFGCSLYNLEVLNILLNVLFKNSDDTKRFTPGISSVGNPRGPLTVLNLGSVVIYRAVCKGLTKC